jgi:Arc/MetJ-type ribon-helix-helix transcriptional regulator
MEPGVFAMTITLTPEQQDVIEHAIEAGLIRSVDEFIGSAVEALAGGARKFDRERARLAVDRIRDLRQGVNLDLQGMSIRELAHAGHRY